MFKKFRLVRSALFRLGNLRFKPSSNILEKKKNGSEQVMGFKPKSKYKTLNPIKETIEAPNNKLKKLLFSGSTVLLTSG